MGERCEFCEAGHPRWRIDGLVVHLDYAGEYVRCKDQDRATDLEIKDALRNEITGSGTC